LRNWCTNVLDYTIDTFEVRVTTAICGKRCSQKFGDFYFNHSQNSRNWCTDVNGFSPCTQYL